MRPVSVAVICLGLGACVHVMQVAQVDASGDPSKATNVAGIPFRVKKEQFRQTTVRSSIWIRATLTVQEQRTDHFTRKPILDGNTKQTFVKDVENYAELESLTSHLLGEDSITSERAQELIQEFNHIPTFRVDAVTSSSVVKNVTEAEWVVDSSKTYYLNAPLPWFGTGTITQEMNADGTLSKTSANVDTKLSTAISTLIPVRQILTKAFNTSPVLGANAGLLEKQMAVEDVAYTFTLETTELGRQYVLTKLVTNSSPAPPIELCEVQSGTAMVDIKDLGESEKPVNDEANASSTMRIQGTVSIPKDWNAAPKQPSK